MVAATVDKIILNEVLNYYQIPRMFLVIVAVMLVQVGSEGNEAARNLRY